MNSRKHLRLGLLAGAAAIALAACGGSDKAPEPDNAAPAAAPADAAPTPASDQTPNIQIESAKLGARIAALSSDEFDGRAPTTHGGADTRAWLIQQMKDIGLKPVKGDNYEQSVPMVESTLDPDASSLTVNGETLAYGPEAMYWTKRVQDEVSFKDSDLVFVGYGVVAPEYDWNDYAGVDVKGKTVVILVNDPGFATGEADFFNGKAMTYYGRWTYKYEEAARQGAAAAIIVHQTAPAAYGWGVVEGSWSGPQLDLERDDEGASRVALEGWIQKPVADKLFNEAGLNFETLEAAASKRGFKAVPMKGLKASATIKNTIRHSKSANVIGVIPGTERPDEYVLYMAHWDHLGEGDAPGDDHIWNGAVDNGTGAAGILTIAEAFMKANPQPKRSIMIAEVTGEESGLLGSAYFAQDPIVPLKQIVGGFNIDAMLPTGPSKDLVVIGSGASELEDILKKHAADVGKYLRPDPEPEKGSFYRSDHISLSKKGVPMLYVDSGIDLVDGGEAAGKAAAEDYVENRYHKPADEYSPDWDLSGMTQAMNVLANTGAELAYSDEWPNWYEGNEFRALRDAQRADTATGSNAGDDSNGG